MRTRTLGRLAVLGAAVAAVPAVAGAAVPFFAPGAALFDPEIAVVNSGVIHDVEAVVSADRKYVTLNMRSTQTGLVALREFKFQQDDPPGAGFDGMVGDEQLRAPPDDREDDDGPRGGAGNNARADRNARAGAAGAAAARQQAVGGEDGDAPPPAQRPSEVRRRPRSSVLDREGMTLLNAPRNAADSDPEADDRAAD